MNNSNMFLMNSNKETLWEIMYQNGFFNNINKEPLDIKGYFDTVMNTIENGNKSMSLVEKNKMTLMEVKSYVDNNKKTQFDEIVTSEQIIKQRQDNFTNNLNNKKREFDDIIKKNIPKDVSFSDENDENGESVDKLLEKAIKRREELNIVIPNSNPTSNPNSNPTSNPNINLLNIGETIDNFSNENVELIKAEIERKSETLNDKVLIQIDAKNDQIIELLKEILNLIKDKDVNK
jgi:hypothetical protein|tara:strand:+ start:5698 stop:6399 length:702 start_codon:yes stop_codon:yes gene_type:complete